MRATDFTTIWDCRNIKGPIWGIKSYKGKINISPEQLQDVNIFDQTIITPEQLRDMNIFDLKSVHYHPKNSNIPITLCDHKGNRMRVHTVYPSPQQYGFGYIGKISYKPNFRPDVDSLGGLPLNAPYGVIYDINGNVTTVEDARAQ